MSRKVFLLLAVTVGIVAAPLASAHAKSTFRCASEGGRALVADGFARVYRAKNRLSQPLIYGCAYGSRRPYVLGPVPECTGSGCVGLEGTPVLAGPVAAYELFSSSRPCCRSWMIIVRDLRNGRILRRSPTGAPSEEGDVGGGYSSAIVVKDDGAVAWILSGGPARGNEVHVVDADGSRVLASGADVDEHSLALAGSTVYWTQAGKPFSAPLR